MEGNDPAVTGEKDMGMSGAMGGAAMAEDVEWGGDRRSGDGEPEKVDTGFDSKDLEDATKYHRDKNGKREFKGGSPLYPGKGGTIVAREGLLKSLKNKFGKIKTNNILNEDVILEEDDE